MSKKLTKKQKEELEKLSNEILNEAKKVVDDYVNYPSEISGSRINVFYNSPLLDVDKEGNILYSGSGWTKIIKTQM
tara:strand:- start:290 stop:517 length:228 start_codon:yes stop_codon:yes gene_type:complete